MLPLATSITFLLSWEYQIRHVTIPHVWAQSQVAPALRQPLSVAVYWRSPQQQYSNTRSFAAACLCLMWVNTPTPVIAARYRTVSISVLKPMSYISKRQTFTRCRAYIDLPAETQDARKLPLNNGYTSKVRVLDRYEVVGFISSGTYGKVYKAVGVKGQSGEFAIKKCVQFHIRIARQSLTYST